MIKSAQQKRRKLTARIRRIMGGKGVTLQSLAEIVGVKPRTLDNVILGAAHSLSTEQKVTNVLGCQIWPDVPITEARLSLPAGMIIYTGSTRLTAQLCAELSDSCTEIRPNLVRLNKNLFVTFPKSGDDAPPAEGKFDPAAESPAPITFFEPECGRELLAEWDKGGGHPSAIVARVV